MKRRITGLHPYRCKENPDEARFAKAWEEFNKKLGAEGRTHLDYLMDPSGGYPQPSSDRDELVAATLIQWLGSPVGQDFLWGCGFEKPPIETLIQRSSLGTPAAKRMRAKGKVILEKRKRAVH